ncbi:HAD-IIIC family phosphatase [Chondromyces crocatus]|uniref:N-acetyltransferase domain-containing protein n=1 Tax=Chondromyces crocatus TaxID=52 RepID=A0A0K1EKR2_CHOCO|nr:HAD-IIIC family phosphatase [Chondromyces crocatus]AKT41193.1 uncharacterized protein CMC5_053540 [Chondromyces crocatus]
MTEQRTSGSGSTSEDGLGQPSQAKAERGSRSIKCVVWDLDNTLWNGILLEGDRLELREDAVEIIKVLDERGILHSIASRNDPERALEQLKAFGLQDYFLHPQIGWNAKSSSVKRIAAEINIGLDALAFIDDQPFEREEVNFSLPDVLCLDVADLARVPAMPEFNPRFVTSDARLRREMYQRDVDRKVAREQFVGTEEDFLASLGMVFTLGPAKKDDLMRVEELTLRTNQLNSTGYTFSYEELDRLRCSPDHKLLIAGLTDRFGSYGKIGLAVLECAEGVWAIKLLLMSCRVISRGVGTIMLNHIMRLAQGAGVRLVAEFIATERNRMMYITYKFAGFKGAGTREGVELLECELSRAQPLPAYVQLQLED